jgi:hypothetical protein
MQPQCARPPLGRFPRAHKGVFDLLCHRRLPLWRELTVVFIVKIPVGDQPSEIKRQIRTRVVRVHLKTQLVRNFLYL